MFSPGQNVVYSTDTEEFPGQVWGVQTGSGHYIVNVPALNKCVVAQSFSLMAR